MPPLQSVTSITYYDDDGYGTVFASSDYIVDTDSTPGQIVLKNSASWPSFTPLEIGAVRIRFVCGYGLAVAVPEQFRQAIKLLVGHWYENREAIATSGAVPKEVPLAVESLLMLDRVF